MFDIVEYFNNSGLRENGPNMADIENDISDDIEHLLNNRFDKLYTRDTYKHDNGSIEIIAPRHIHPQGRSIILSPDRIRFLLSFYPNKKNFGIWNRNI